MTKINCNNVFPETRKPRPAHSSFPHFQSWLTAFKEDNQPWEPPLFDTFYRVQGPFQIKHTKSKISLQLSMFIARLDNATEYRFSSTIQCTAIVDSITPLSAPRDKPKQFRVIATLQNVDSSRFYTYHIRELESCPEQKIICYKPEAGDQLFMIYTPGVPDLEYQGIVYQCVSNGYVIPCYTPPADHNGNYLLREDKNCQIGFEVYGLPHYCDYINTESSFPITECSPKSQREICCRIVPCLFGLNNSFVRNFTDRSFYINLKRIYQMIPYTDQSSILIGQISGCAEDRLLAQTRHFLYPNLNQVADLIPATSEKNLAKFFAKDSLVQIRLNNSNIDSQAKIVTNNRSDTPNQTGYVQSIIGPNTPYHGLFPCSRK